ncbi:MAG: hypothetical protein VW945_06875, partial [Candidatus Poseidoniales archaeon]
TAELDFARGKAPFMAVLTLTLADNLTEGDYTVVISGQSGDTVRSDEITFSITSLPEFSLDIDNREQLLTEGEMTIAGAIDAHNGLDLSMGGMLDIIVEPYNQALIDSAVITWGEIDANGDLTFSVVFDVDESIPLHEYTIQLNVVTLDGGIAHAASVAFVTESSTLDGTAVAAEGDAVVSGDTSQHDGTDTVAEAVGGDDDGGGADNGGDDGDDTSDSEAQSSNTMLVAGSAIGVLGIIIGVAVVVLRGRGSAGGKNFSDHLWTESSVPQAVMAQPGVMGAPAKATMMQQPMAQQPVQPAVQQPVQPGVQQPVMSAPAPPAMATAPPPPAQPTTVADYTGLPPGGTYDQSTGQTVYIQADGVQWQMMPDGTFNRLN